MSRKDRQKVPRDLAQEGNDEFTTVNWRPLTQFHGPDTPCLIWPSIVHIEQRAESDSLMLPGMAFIEQRHRWNSNETEQDSLLGCKAFWDAFRRSKLVIVFDRHVDTRLLKRLRDDAQAGILRSLETLIVLTGKDQKSLRVKFVKEIESALALEQVKFHFVPEMTSTVAPFPHDRFAVTDGEFWHFGGSNVGLEPCLTAVSRGWRAEKIGVREFIEAAWTAMASKGIQHD